MRHLLFGLAAAVASGVVQAQEVRLRHALEGRQLDALATFAVRFNDEQKGKAKVILEDLRGVADRHRLPEAALLDPDDSLAFFDSRPRFRSLAQLMAEAGERLDEKKFYPQIGRASCRERV